jgi:uncharacterized RDD family membrane protein YckC
VLPDDDRPPDLPDDEWPAGLVPASPWRRVAGRLVDLVIVAAVATAAAVLIAAATGGVPEPGPDGTAELPAWIPYVSFLVGGLYEVGFVARSGQTPGKRLLSVKVVAVPSARVPEVPAAVVRWFIVAGVLSLPSPLLLQLVLVLAVTGLCLVPIFTRVDRRGFHDRFSGTAAVVPVTLPEDPWS